jgi:hypothetical protein
MMMMMMMMMMMPGEGSQVKIFSDYLSGKKMR